MQRLRRMKQHVLLGGTRNILYFQSVNSTIFVKHLLCGRNYSRCWGYRSNQGRHISFLLYLSALAMIKYHRLGGLNNRKLFSHNSGG